MSIPAYAYSQNVNIAIGEQFLEILCIAFLVLNCVSEVSGAVCCALYLSFIGGILHFNFVLIQSVSLIDIVKAVHRFELMQYFSLWNVIDLSHFSVMWAAWYFRLHQINLSNTLEMPSGFAVLTSFSEETLARQFLSNPDKEYMFLEFLDHLKQMRDNLTTYSVLTSVAGAKF